MSYEDDIQVGEVTKPASAPFSKAGGLPEDHPVVKAFRMSWESGEALEIATSTPDLVVKMLRKVAGKLNLGVRVQANEDSVVFQAKERRTPTKKDQEATE